MNHATWTRTLMVAAIFLVAWSIDQAVAGPTVPTREPDKTVGGKIVGVVEKNGQPVANAQVRLIKPLRSPQTQPSAGRRGGAGAARGARGAGLAQLTPVAQTSTDAQGHFSFNDIQPGIYGVLAGERGQGVGRERVMVKPGQTEEVKIDLQPLGRGAGRGGRGGPTTQAAG